MYFTGWLYGANSVAWSIDSNPQATRRTLQEFYSSEYPNLVQDYIAQAEAQIPQHREFFRQLSMSRKGVGRFLDVGCATGHLLAAGREMGWDVYGVELSEVFSQYARETLGLKNVFMGELYEARFPDSFFDYIQMWHVLEHVPDAQGTLTEVKRILKNDCEIRVGVPNIDEPWYKLYRVYSRLRGRVPGVFTSDQHTFKFTPHTFRRMLESVGFAIKDVRIYYNLLSETIGACDSHKIRIVWRLVYYLGCLLPNRFGTRMSISGSGQDVGAERDGKNSDDCLTK